MQYFILSMLLLFFSVITQAQIYKWVDQEGNTQYTGHPPSSGAARDERKLNIKSSPAPSTNVNAGTSNSLVEEKLEFDKRRLEKKEAEAKLQAEAEVNKRKCIAAQGKLKIFRNSPRLAFPDGKGGIVYADDAMRQEKIDEAKKDIASFCNL